MKTIAWYYRLLFKSLHPLKFELYRNYIEGTIKYKGPRFGKRITIFKYEIDKEGGENSEDKFILIRNEENQIEKIKSSYVKADRKKFINVQIKHRCWFDQYNVKICEHADCHKHQEIFSEKTYKVYERDGNFRNLGFYMNTLKPYEDIKDKYVSNVNVRIGRFLRSHIPVEVVHLIGVSCILHVYDGYFRAPELNTLVTLNKRLNQATAKKLHMSSTPRLSLLNMPKRYGGLKLGSIVVRTVTRIMNQIENFMNAKDIETRLTFEINVYRTFKKINNKRRKKLTWREINNHPWSIVRLMDNKMDRFGWRIHLLKHFSIGVNQHYEAEDWDKNILSITPYYQWSKIIAIKLFHGNKIKSFEVKKWRVQNKWCEAIESSTILLNVEGIRLSKKRFFNYDTNFWSIGGIPFCRRPKKMEDGTDEIVDQQLFRIQTVRNIERYLAVLRTTDTKLKTSELYRTVILDTDSEVTNLVFKHKIRFFIVKALTSKLSTPMLLRFNSWYPNLNSEIKRLDNEVGKDENPLRLCGVSDCKYRFNNNHVLTDSCKYYSHWELDRKIAIFKVFVKCKYARSTLKDLQQWNIVNMLGKKDIAVKSIKKLYTENKGIIVPTGMDLSNLFILVETDRMKIVMKEEHITDELIKHIMIRVLVLDNKYPFWFRNQRFGELINKLFPREVMYSNVMMPWIKVTSQRPFYNPFHIDIREIGNMTINLEISNLGFVPKEYIGWLATQFTVPVKRIHVILSEFAIEIAKITKKLYKHQLRAHQFVRKEMGIIKQDPNQCMKEKGERSCGMCSGSEGVLCYKHKLSRLRLLKQRIGQGLGECSHFSRLMAAVLPGDWHKIKSSKQRSKIFKHCLKLLRCEAIRIGCLPKELSVENWEKRARHYRTAKNKELDNSIQIEPLVDYYNTYEEQMIGDFPILLRQKSYLDIFIPTRILDEITFLAKGSKKSKMTSHRLERKCESAYFTKPGFGYIGSKYIYHHKSELINRKIIYYKEPFNGIGRKLKCIGIDNTQDMDKAIFRDYLGEVKLNEEALRKLGYSKILSE